MIPFNEPVYVEKGIEYINQAIIKNKRLNGDGPFTAKVTQWMEKKFNANKVLMTTSCTHALEMAALLSDIKEGDEVIMPSYTFVSTADAFVLRGARIKFVDIRPDTMNIDECKIEDAITPKTRAIVPVHYAGVGCEMDTIMDIANRHNLVVIEDAAQGMMSTYKGRYLGTIGDFGAYSFHETKNYTMGEGGSIFIRSKEDIERAEIVREKGTNRQKFFRGEVDKYSWVDKGSSYLPSEMNVAYLYAQLECAEEINNNRLESWKRYYDGFKKLQEMELIELPSCPKECKHNAHMFYFKVNNLEQRTDIIKYLKAKEVGAVFHYVPLHTSKAGMRYGEFVGEDEYTTKESNRLVRLPMFYNLNADVIEFIIETIYDYYKQ